MKNALLLVLLLLAPLSAMGQMSDADLKTESDLRKLTFTVTTNKEHYLPFEPIFVKFKMENSTEGKLDYWRPLLFRTANIRLTNPNGEVKNIEGYSQISGGGVNMLPGSETGLPPGRWLEAELVPEALRPELTLIAGRYKLQFEIHKLKSNEVDFEITSPEGANKAAFDFISENGRDIWYGSLFERTDRGNQLKTFVQLYADTDYGVYGIRLLALYYHYIEKDLDRAEAEFEKLRDSDNQALSREIKPIVADIKHSRENLVKPRDLPKNERR